MKTKLLSYPESFGCDERLPALVFYWCQIWLHKALWNRVWFDWEFCPYFEYGVFRFVSESRIPVTQQFMQPAPEQSINIIWKIPPMWNKKIEIDKI